MQSGTLFQKLLAITIFIGIFYLLYLILKVVFLGLTLYIAYFIYAFNGGTDVEAFRAGTTYALLTGADYVLSVLAAMYLAWKIDNRALRALFSPDKN